MKKKQVKKRTVFTIMYIPTLNKEPWPTLNIRNPHFTTLKKAVIALKREEARYGGEYYFILQHEA